MVGKGYRHCKVNHYQIEAPNQLIPTHRWATCSELCSCFAQASGASNKPHEELIKALYTAANTFYVKLSYMLNQGLARLHAGYEQSEHSACPPFSHEFAVHPERADLCSTLLVLYGEKWWTFIARITDRECISHYSLAHTPTGA